MTTKTQRVTDERKATEAAKGENGSGRSKNKKTLDDLLETGLKDIYSAETQLLTALPEVAQAADSDELEEAINHHLEQTKKQVSRLEKIFERLEISKSEMEKCAAMEGLIEENKKIMNEFPRSAVRDAALIIGAQKIEHYEIAVYGSLCELADVLGEDRICDLLEKSLEEEEETDQYLTEIAEEINDEAIEFSRESER
jgi:ferritin-like metal-binding protein YciE